MYLPVIHFNNIKFIKFLSFILIFSIIHTIISTKSFAKTINIVLNLSETPTGQVESFWLKRYIEYSFKKLKTIYPNNNISIRFLNDEGTIDGAIRIAQKLNNDPTATVVIGGYSSLTALPLAKTLKGKAFINIFSTANQTVTDATNQVRLIATNEAQGSLIANWSYHVLNKRNPCMVFEADDGFSPEIQAAIRSTYKNLGISLRAFSYSRSISATINSAQIRCYEGQPDIIIHSGISVSAKQILNFHLKQALINPSHRIPILGSDGWGDVKLILSGENERLLRQVQIPVFLSYYWDSVPRNPVQKELWLYLKTSYNETAEPFTLLGHDAVMIAASYIMSKNQYLINFIQSEAPIIPLAILENKGKFQIPLSPKIYQVNPDFTLIQKNIPLSHLSDSK